MKTQIAARLLVGTLCIVSSNAWATLPRSAVSKMTLPVYGIYMTSDPLCATGLVATVPLAKTATTVDMTQAPTIGSGSIPAAGIGCVIIVMGSGFAATWSSGTYEPGTSDGNSDAPCDSGGSTRRRYVCLPRQFGEVSFCDPGGRGSHRLDLNEFSLCEQRIGN